MQKCAGNILSSYQWPYKAFKAGVTNLELSRCSWTTIFIHLHQRGQWSGTGMRRLAVFEPLVSIRLVTTALKRPSLQNWNGMNCWFPKEKLFYSSVMAKQQINMKMPGQWYTLAFHIWKQIGKRMLQEAVKRSQINLSKLQCMKRLTVCV